MKNRYYSLPNAPEEISVQNVICRLIASIGFRYYWATEGLSPKWLPFRPSEDSRSIDELLDHIWDLLNWTYSSVDSKSFEKPQSSDQLREATLELIESLEMKFASLESEELASIILLKPPFWSVINGPLADVLTHIGQIATVRRIAGDPVKESNPFSGTPPVL